MANKPNQYDKTQTEKKLYGRLSKIINSYTSIYHLKGEKVNRRIATSIYDVQMMLKRLSPKTREAVLEILEKETSKKLGNGEDLFMVLGDLCSDAITIKNEYLESKKNSKSTKQITQKEETTPEKILKALETYKEHDKESLYRVEKSYIERLNNIFLSYPGKSNYIARAFNAYNTGMYGYQKSDLIEFLELNGIVINKKEPISRNIDQELLRYRVAGLDAIYSVFLEKIKMDPAAQDYSTLDEFNDLIDTISEIGDAVYDLYYARQGYSPVFGIIEENSSQQTLFEMMGKPEISKDKKRR